MAQFFSRWRNSICNFCSHFRYNIYVLITHMLNILSKIETYTRALSPRNKQILPRSSPLSLKVFGRVRPLQRLSRLAQKAMDTNNHTTETINPNPKNNRAASYTDAMKLEVVKRCVLSPVVVYLHAPNIIPWGRGHSYQGFLRVGFGPNKSISRVSDFVCT